MSTNFEIRGQETQTSFEQSSNLYAEAFEVQRLKDLVKHSDSIVALAAKSAESICDHYCKRLFEMSPREQAEFIDSISCFNDRYDLVWNGIRERYNEYLEAQMAAQMA